VPDGDASGLAFLPVALGRSFNIALGRSVSGTCDPATSWAATGFFVGFAATPRVPPDVVRRSINVSAAEEDRSPPVE
jgi:hypothetical protein